MKALPLDTITKKAHITKKLADKLQLVEINPAENDINSLELGPFLIVGNNGRLYLVKNKKHKDRLSNVDPRDSLPCDWCAGRGDNKPKRTAVTEIWSNANPEGHYVRLCQDCASGCAG